jgi:hypothetical protein
MAADPRRLTARFADKRVEQADDLVNAVVHVVGEPRHEHGIDQRGGRRDVQRPPVEKRPAAALRREELFSVGIVNRADCRLAVELERQG